MNLREILKGTTLVEAELWLAYCLEAGIEQFTIIPDDEAANA